MTSESIWESEETSAWYWMKEIAYQLALLNEREEDHDAEKEAGYK